MLTRFAIMRRADDDGVDALVTERDYVLAHIVAQLHRAKPTNDGQLVFKGGTALRLVHFRNYRYSADLDFTIVGANASAATASMVGVGEFQRPLQRTGHDGRAHRNNEPLEIDPSPKSRTHCLCGLELTASEV